jgi:hypothetical protein
MAAVDFERAWLAMKEEVLMRRSHGQDGLLAALARIEPYCRVPEGHEVFDPTPLPSGSTSKPALAASGA